MTRYEYKVLPAPARAVKVRGVKTTEERFAHALMTVMNELGAKGWEYLRTDTLPCEERVGLTGRTTRFQNMLVFRRPLPEAPVRSPAPAPQERPLPLPAFQSASRGSGHDRETGNVWAREAEAARGSEDEDGGKAGHEAPRGSVAQRLAATLPTRVRPGKAPSLRSGTEPGAAPRLGGAPGKGVSRPADTEPNNSDSAGD